MDQRGPPHPRLGCSKNLNMARYNSPSKKNVLKQLYIRSQTLSYWDKRYQNPFRNTPSQELTYPDKVKH